MDIITSLGVNSTVFIQFGIFFVVYLFLETLVFRPYYKALLVRREKTVGNAELAERFIKETQGLEEEYTLKAREMNDQFREMFDKSRSEAMKEYDSVVSAAREKSRATLEAARQKIEGQATAAREELKKQVPEVAAVIVGTVLGKEAAR